MLRSAATVDALGWRRAARAARWHLSSRLNAMTRVVGVIPARQWSSLAPLLQHVFTNRLPGGHEL